MNEKTWLKNRFQQKLPPSPRITNASVTQDHKLWKKNSVLALPGNSMLVAKATPILLLGLQILEAFLLGRRGE